VLENLYPLLDSHGTGVIQPDQLLFLEKDIQKRATWEKILEKRRDEQYGSFIGEAEETKAHDFIRDIAFKTTRCGKQHWKMMPYNAIMGGPPPKESRPQPLFKPSRSESSPSFTRQRTPRFLREFREARRQGKLVGKAAREAREARLGNMLEACIARPRSAVQLGRRATESGPASVPPRPASASALSRTTPTEVGSAKLGKHGHRRRHEMPVVWARNDSISRNIVAQRKAYCGSQVAVQVTQAHTDLQKLDEACKKHRVANRRARHLDSLEKMKVNPCRSFDFCASRKSLAIFDYYDIGQARS
jgi:hypothetical protein